MTFHGQPTRHFLGKNCAMISSRYLSERVTHRFLTDCGLFWEFKHLRRENRKPTPARPVAVDAAFRIRTHRDHAGYLPALICALERLIAVGTRSPVYVIIQTVFAGSVYEDTRAAGPVRIVTTDRIPHGSNSFSLADGITRAMSDKV